MTSPTSSTQNASKRAGAEESQVPKVSEAHPHLYHYTTGAGLHGIVESRALWATNVFFLNDSSEYVGFVERRLPLLIEQGIRAQVVASWGGRAPDPTREFEVALGAEVARLQQVFGDFLAKIGTHYIASFCSASTPDATADGLLSQWRAYGPDGGYALVFDTAAMESLLADEMRDYLYHFAIWGDIEYYDGLDEQKAALPETVSNERIVRDAFSRLHERGAAPAVLEPALEPLLRLACTHKHHGFREEQEVRIVVVPPGRPDEVETWDKHRPVRPLRFVNRGGTLVPHIELFARDDRLAAAQLPIRRVIVGPHRDQRRRVRAVELLLAANGVEAAVTASGIPYICGA